MQIHLLLPYCFFIIYNTVLCFLVYFVVTVSNVSQNLAESLLKKGEDANAVETDRKQGYGPIHYIVTGKHKFKRELLLVLFVHGKAELDLTTTQHGMTALRLAVEVR